MSGYEDRIAAATQYSPIRLLLDSSGIGGIETHVATLCTGLRRRGIDARIALLKHHGENPWYVQLERAGLPFDVLDGNFGSLMRLIGPASASLVHTHGYKGGTLGRVACALRGTPVISSFHAGERGRLPVSLYQTLDEWTSFLAGRISVSPAIRDQLPFTSTLVDNFIDVAKTEPHPPGSGIGFAGRLSHEKGPDYFCALASGLTAAAEWHVFGDGPMRQELQAAHRDAVRFHGMISNISEAWRQVGLLVVSSRAEGLPMAVIEAMAAGVPVAAARIGALPDVIEDGANGWLFDIGDVEAMGSIVRRWLSLDSAQKRHMQLAAWRTARDRYGMDRGVGRILEVYAQQMNLPRRTSSRSYAQRSI